MATSETDHSSPNNNLRKTQVGLGMLEERSAAHSDSLQRIENRLETLQDKLDTKYSDLAIRVATLEAAGSRRKGATGLVETAIVVFSGGGFVGLTLLLYRVFGG